MNYVFISCCSGISHLWIKTGNTLTQKGQKTDYIGQETDYPFRKSSTLCCSVINFLEPRVSQFRAMKETNIKNLCCSWTINYFHAAQKPLFLFCAAHRNKQKYFEAFSLLWDDTKSTNCPGRADFAKARYMKSFSIYKKAGDEADELFHKKHSCTYQDLRIGEYRFCEAMEVDLAESEDKCK